MTKMHVMANSVVILLKILSITTATHITIDLTINENQQGVVLKKFWTSTGLSPPVGKEKEYLLSKDMELGITIMGAVPHGGLTHVRIHWLLNLVTVRNVSAVKVEYNFNDLDTVLHRLNKNGLFPGFELMGSPTNLAKDFSTKMREWRIFLQKLIDRYGVTFGQKQLQSWRFETLNEPDLQQYNLWNLTLSEYINYVTTSANVLSSKGFKLWGPAGLFKNGEKHTRCWGILEFCNHNECPISVLSFHKKGDGKASQVVKGGEDLIRDIYIKYPHIKKLPISNDEADPLTGWWKSARWRADVRYSSALAQTIIGYIYLAQRTGIDIASISNDNGFFSYEPYFWTQRTLFARLKVNKTNSTFGHLLKKPVYSTMVLLSLLGNTTLKTIYNPGEPGLSSVVTMEGSRRVILLTLSHDTLNVSSTRRKRINLQLTLSLPKSNSRRRGVMYLQDNFITNPARLWRKAGSPTYPDNDLLRQLRKAGEPHELETLDIRGEENSIDLVLPLRVPSVLLINICSCDDTVLGDITDLRYVNFTQNEILLIWNDDTLYSRCIQTYKVQFQAKDSTGWNIIHAYQFFTSSFYFDGCIPIQKGRKDECKEGNVEGVYKITPVHYCGMEGSSESILVY